MEDNMVLWPGHWPGVWQTWVLFPALPCWVTLGEPLLLGCFCPLPSQLWCVQRKFSAVPYSVCTAPSTMGFAGWSSQH